MLTLAKLYAAACAFVVLVFAWTVLDRGDPERRLQVTGGFSTVSFYPAILEGKKLRAVWNPTGGVDRTRAETSYGFSFDFSNLAFTVDRGRISRFDGGAISHRGGFKLVSGSKSVGAEGFVVRPNRAGADGLELVVGGKEPYTAFDLTHASAIYDPQTKRLVAGNLDVTITERCAQALGRPELAGTVIGYLKVLGDAVPIDGGGEVDFPSPPTGDVGAAAGIDVSISDMGGFSYVARTGTYPDGISAFTMYTTSCNVGSEKIPWNPPMSTTHPGILMSIYRVLNGRFEQVAWSWVKHGFYATNATSCGGGSCGDPGGYYLGLRCTDTYGGGNNADQYYLGGRDEWNAQTGVWTCQGSWFSNYQNDCIRRNSGSGLGPVAHRLAGPDADLGNAGAQYYYEAYYINANDIDPYNQICSRAATIRWTGTTWSTSTTGSMVAGPTINRWGEQRSTAQPQTDGDVIVGVQTTNLGNGMWRYEFAVFNFTLDRAIREFKVPLPGGATLENVGFRDTDQDATNQWQTSVANDAITWSTGVFGSSTANPLKYLFVYNFRFDANVPPVAGNVTLGMFKPGNGDTLTAATKTPALLSPVDDFQVVNGTLLGGNLQSLSRSDDDKVSIRGNAAGQSSGVLVTATATQTTLQSLVIGVESSDAVPTAAGISQTIELWNWTTGAWESVDFRPVSPFDRAAFVTISSDPSRFVNSTNRQVQARILHSSTNLALLPRPAFDVVGFQYN